MNDFAIRAEKLSKLYFIGGDREKYRTLRDSLTDAAASSLRYFRSAFNHAGDGESPREGRGGDKPFWAIQDISFEVKRGEKDDELFIEAWLDLGNDLSRGYFYCLIADAIGAHVVHQRIDARDLGYDMLEVGSYHVRVSMPPLWLSPGAYTVYFKFIGIRADGETETHTSERILLDVVGSAAGNSTALLAPDAQWSLESEAY